MKFSIRFDPRRGTFITYVDSLHFACKTSDMSTLVPKVRKEITFIWKVENYSYCWHRTGEYLTSPVFVAGILQNTEWTLCLYPRGDLEEHYLSCYLQREKEVDGPPTITVSYEIGLLAEDDTVHNLYVGKKSECLFKCGTGYGPSKFASFNEVLVHSCQKYLPQDTLTIYCRLWTYVTKVNSIVQSFARTRIQVETVSFVHVIENFPRLNLHKKEFIEIESSSVDRPVIDVGTVLVNDSLGEEGIVLEITAADETKTELSTCKIHLLDASRELIKCGSADSRLDFVKKSALIVPLTFSKKKLINRRNDYLPRNALVLRCECTFSTGVDIERIEKTVHGLHVIPPPVEDGASGGALSKHCTVSGDLSLLYNDQILTDVTLKTKTGSFPVHRAVLAARSPEFKSMFTSKKETEVDSVVVVEDLDDDTVQRLLLFLYTGVLEDLQWDTAYKLLKAAEKYQIEHLKIKCTSFLLGNISPSNASHLLLLADRNKNEYMRVAVEHFILDNEEEVFSSSGWDDLMNTDSKLASRTMHLRYKKKEG
ncbi:BTB and MATH domain-containing protein 43 [Caerostris darwini]|uniref:BTB and MATH domain-containing protein 43 n=1 Tax=Caerostris darwini TaxID=1538125 RepID=A0AAV4VG24_9ARAC|nr:BTB and MATH domain-containing protein 43 [Caerostris darwini]